MQSKSDNSVCALTNPFADNVVVEIVDGRARCTELLVFRGRRAFHLIDLRFV